MTTVGTNTLPASDRLALTRGPLLAGGVLLVAFVWLYWDFLATQVRWALRHQADWGHVLVMPLIAAYFAYRARERLLAVPFRTTWIGLVPIVFGVAWYSVCSLTEAVRHHNLQAFGVWTSLFGLVLLFFGWRAMRWLWFPLVYLLVFGQSVSDRGMSIITFELQDIAARGAHFVLMLIGTDVERAGNTLVIFDGQGQARPLNIAEACSGMRMLMAFLALGVAMAYLGLSRLWQQAALVLMAVPTALFVNVLRVSSLVLLSLFDVGLAAGDFHTFVGLIWLVPALFIYLGLMWIIRRLVQEAPS